MKTICLLATVLLQTLPVHGALRIIDERGQPVTGASVEMIVGGGGEMTSFLPAIVTTMKSGQDGVVPLRLPSSGEVVLIVDHPAFAPVVVLPAESPLELRLDTGEVWEGRLQAEGKSSVAGSQVQEGEVCAAGRLNLEPLKETRGWRRCAPVREGAFRVEGLPPGSFQVHARASGLLPLSRTVDPLKEHVLVLKQGVLLNGVVNDGRGHPLMGAAVSSGKGETVQTAKDGRFSIAVPELPARLTVRAQGFRDQSLDVQRSAEIGVRLTPGEQVYGVLLGESGEEVRKATVWIEKAVDDPRRESIRRQIEVAEGGEFSVDVPAPGSYTLRFQATGFQQLRLSSIHVGAEGAVSVGVLALKRGAGVRGTLVDATNGRLVEGALVEGLPAGPLLLQLVKLTSTPSDLSDGDGRFTVGGLGIGRYLIRIQASQGTIHRLVDLETNDLVDMGTLPLKPGVVLHGRIPDRRSGPRAGTQLRLFDPAREFLEPLAIATTDAAGAFRFPAMEAGHYRLEIKSARLLLVKEIELPEGTDSFELELDLRETQIRGLITYDGRPVGGGTVRLTSMLDPAQRRGKLIMRRSGATLSWGLPQSSVAGEVDEQGRFVIDDAPVGPLRVFHAGTTGRTAVLSAYVPQQSEVSLPLDLKGHLLEGYVREAGTGVALSGTIRLFDASGHFVIEAPAGPAGHFVFQNLESGVYDLEARVAGYKPNPPVTVHLTGEVPPIILELQPGQTGTLRVSLNRTDGSGVGGVPVSIFDSRGVLTTAFPTLDSGQRKFEGLPSGDYFVGWSDALAGAGWASKVLVGPSETSDIAATLDVGTQLVITCPRHTCAGAAAELLEVENREGLDVAPLLSGMAPALRFSEDGRVTLGRIMPGRYLIRVWAAGQRWEREVSVGSETARVAFD